MGRTETRPVSAETDAVSFRTLCDERCVVTKVAMNSGPHPAESQQPRLVQESLALKRLPAPKNSSSCQLSSK